MTRKTNPAPAPEAEAKPESEAQSSKVRASDVIEDVFTAIQKAGPEGISLKALEDATGIRYRVLHNVTYHLEVKSEAPRIRRVGDGRKLVFASVEQASKPAPRKRQARKAPAKATAKAA
jgi:hypothetical protein